MITVGIKGDKELIERLNAMPNNVRAALKQKITTLSLLLEAKVKAKLSGDVLNVRSGNLRRSIHSTVTDDFNSVVGKVFSSGDVKYAAIQEYGGTTPPHVIEAKGSALAFMMGGKQVFAKRVNHPGSKIPARSYMGSSLEDMAEQIRTGIREAVIEGARK